MSVRRISRSKWIKTVFSTFKSTRIVQSWLSTNWSILWAILKLMISATLSSLELLGAQTCSISAGVKLTDVATWSTDSETWLTRKETWFLKRWSSILTTRSLHLSTKELVSSSRSNQHQSRTVQPTRSRTTQRRLRLRSTLISMDSSLTSTL